MAKDLAEVIAAEEAAIAAYKELMAAKKKEIAALTKMIEDKLTRIAELGVEIATMKNDLGDTAEGLIEDKKFLADLEKNCATKEKEWAEICKQRQLELVALADTIKILNDDDALGASPFCIASRKLEVPDFAMVPRLFTRSSFVIPTPVSRSRRTLFARSKEMRIFSLAWSPSPSASGSDRARKRILSRASEAFEMSSRRKISFFE